MKITLTIILTLFTTVWGVAQETWNLEKCIAYADSSNLDIQHKRIDLLIAEIHQKQAKLNVLPTLNLGGTHGYNWGQRVDPFTNQFATDQVRTNSFYAGSSWDIFSGLKNYYLIHQNNSKYGVTEQKIEIAKRNLTIDITAAYMQVVLNQYLIEAAEKQVEYALKSEKLAKERYESGYVTHYDVLSMSSQLIMDSTALTQAINNKKYSSLLLMQLLNRDKELKVEIPSIDELTNKNPVFNKKSFLANPEFELARLQTDVQEYQIKIAKARLIPTLSINSSIGSGYSGNSKKLVGSEYLPKPFRVQMQENFYQSAMLTLNVPLFNHGRVRSEIKIAEAELSQTEIEQKLLIQKLHNRLEQLENEIQNEQLNASALKRALQASKERFEAATEKYNAGTINVQNYIDLRKTVFKTQTEYYTSLITLRFKEKMEMEMY